MKPAIILFFSFLVHPCFAQNEMSGIVFGSTSGQPVAYATIRSALTQMAIDTDEGGAFNIVANKYDTLIISCIGYKEKRVSLYFLNSIDTIYLEESPVTLDEIIVEDAETMVLGILDKKFGSSRVGGAYAERSEIVTLIEIPDHVRHYRVKEVFIKARRFDESNPIRLHLYSVNDHGLPDEELLKESTIIKKENFDKKTGVITVDIRKQNILLGEESFFVGIQWITDNEVKWPTGPEIIQTKKVPRILSYYRSTNPLCNECWNAYNHRSIVLYPDGKKPGYGGPLKGNPLNMCASAEIELIEIDDIE